MSDLRTVIACVRCGAQYSVDLDHTGRSLSATPLDLSLSAAEAERARLRPLLERCLLEAEATNGMILTDPNSGATRPVVNSILLADLRSELKGDG